MDQRFMAAVFEVFDSDGGEAEVLPAALAQACVRVLPVAGAGVSCTDELRIPLGASDDTAVRAERLQTTLGEGPCLTATATSAPLRASASVMALRWPVFHSELLRQTPYRSVISMPLQSNGDERFGALDLYSVDPDGLSDLVMDQICTEVADPISSILFDGPSTIYQNQQLPDWLASEAVMDRMTVWIALGMLMEEGVITNSEALSRLRGYAFAHDTTLDELAAQLTTRAITAASVIHAP